MSWKYYHFFLCILGKLTKNFNEDRQLSGRELNLVISRLRSKTSNQLNMMSVWCMRLLFCNLCCWLVYMTFQHLEESREMSCAVSRTSCYSTSGPTHMSQLLKDKSGIYTSCHDIPNCSTLKLVLWTCLNTGCHDSWRHLQNRLQW
jgi:hypothetical protein